MLWAGLAVLDVVRSDVAKAAASAKRADAPVGHANVPPLVASIREPHASGDSDHGWRSAIELLDESRTDPRAKVGVCRLRTRKTRPLGEGRRRRDTLRYIVMPWLICTVEEPHGRPACDADARCYRVAAASLIAELDGIAFAYVVCDAETTATRSDFTWVWLARIWKAAFA